MDEYDILVVGPVSLDIIEEMDASSHSELGGAVIHCAYSAASCVDKVAVFTKFNKKDVNPDTIYDNDRIKLFYKESKETCSIKNKYLTKDRERRICTSINVCDPFKIDELPCVDAKIIHFAGLVYGDFTNDLFKEASKRAKIGLDAQCMLRRVDPDKSMKFYDWDEKREYLKYIDFFKTDAAEAEILTGLSDTHEAAKALYEMGAREIMITHNTEVIIYDGKKIYSCPIKARSLEGRTGRGDTTFASYISERLTKGIEESLKYATALVSLKMETAGPFKGSREDVLKYIEEFY